MYSHYIISDCYNCITENTRTATPYLQALHDNWPAGTFGESHPSPPKHTIIQYVQHIASSANEDVFQIIAIQDQDTALGPF